jgi:GntR family transcriptional regulator, transcriptional repressor for pyruvate dehydrogenase complex
MNPAPGALLDQLFDPIHDGPSLADSVAQRIGDAITAGVILDGQQLPPEDRLAAGFGVSTITLRAALNILRDQELVTTRRGRNGGSFANLSQAAFERKARERLHSTSPIDVRDLGAEQAAIFSASAALAAKRATTENLTRLEGLLEAFDAPQITADLARADSRFHIEISVSAQSERLTRRQVVMQAEYIDLLWLDSPLAQVERCHRQHRDILEAIRAEDADAARAHAEEHVRIDIRRLIELHWEQA